MLDLVQGAATPRAIDVAGLACVTDARWFATLPAESAGAPLLELRRWPGDTVVAVWALAGPLAEEPQPALAGADLVPVGGVGEGRAEWRGTLPTEAGPRPVVWIERVVAPDAARLGALLVPGDAGLDPEVAVEALTSEARHVVDRIEVRPRPWRLHAGVPPGRTLDLPPLAAPPGRRAERDDPWQVVRGSGFTLGLPPGVRARTTDGAVPAPWPLHGGLLWIRGRYTDVDDEEVVLGDARRAGYVAEVRPAGKGWQEGEVAPVGAPGATRIRSETIRLDAFGSPAREARVERWQEEGFPGEWLVFRLGRDDHGVEIGLPVSGGRRSRSLFWIAATWRPAGLPPAPPPLDPAERFGIRFDRLTPAGRSAAPWTEGTLVVPGLAFELPRGWYPVVTLRSEDGFPVHLVDEEGVVRGVLQRRRETELAGLLDADAGFSPVRSPAGSRARATYDRPDGSRILVSREGNGYLIERVGASAPEPARVEELWRRLVGSVRLFGTGGTTHAD